MRPSRALWIAAAAVVAGVGLIMMRGGHPMPLMTTEILLTSEAGDTLAVRPNVAFVAGHAAGTVLTVDPEDRRQTLIGIGSSFTESSAFVLAHLEPADRQEVMQRIWGEDGANFSLARTHIASCDFTVEGKYSYAPHEEDASLPSFSIEVDRAGFDPERYPGVRDSSFDLLPMIVEAQAIKRAQGSPEIRLVASAWTAPPWMKDIDTWYIGGHEGNGWQGTGGSLKPEHESTYAAYIVRYLDAYRAAGVDIWGLTPVNEPHGNSGQWESMHFTPGSQRDFVRDHLGPRLHEGGYADIRLLVYDQNRAKVEDWTDTIFGDPEASAFTAGVAVHWYSSTFKVYEHVFDRLRAAHPDKMIVHTEGCIDDLGKDAPPGVGDPERFKESGWFANDDFWWNAHATDWAYTAPWPHAKPEDHPIYTPVHRYARDILVRIDHGLAGWIDWNIVLNRHGGPNHVGNFCGAPIMIDTDTGQVHYTPVFHVLAQLSRTIRPGDQAVGTELALDGLDEDAIRACATRSPDGLVSVQLLNTTKAPIPMALQIGGQHAAITLPANAVQTVRLRP